MNQLIRANAVVVSLCRHSHQVEKDQVTRWMVRKDVFLVYLTSSFKELFAKWF